MSGWSLLGRSARALFQRSRGVRLEDKPLPEPEAVNAQPRLVTGFFTGLTEQQQKRALAYRGPDSFGDPAKKGC